MTTLRTAIEELLLAVDDNSVAGKDSGGNVVLRGSFLTVVERLRQALGPEPTDDGMKTEDDGFRVEAADQYGFTDFNDDCTEHRCTTAQLVAFAKSCEHAGMFQACDMGSRDLVAKRIAEIDAETNPFILTVTEQRMTAAGYVRAPEGSNLLWVKPESV